MDEDAFDIPHNLPGNWFVRTLSPKEAQRRFASDNDEKVTHMGARAMRWLLSAEESLAIYAQYDMLR